MMWLYLWLRANHNSNELPLWRRFRKTHTKKIFFYPIDWQKSRKVSLFQITVGSGKCVVILSCCWEPDTTHPFLEEKCRLCVGTYAHVHVETHSWYTRRKWLKVGILNRNAKALLLGGRQAVRRGRRDFPFYLCVFLVIHVFLLSCLIFVIGTLMMKKIKFTQAITKQCQRILAAGLTKCFFNLRIS